jgi:hypothetical protein
MVDEMMMMMMELRCCFDIYILIPQGGTGMFSVVMRDVNAYLGAFLFYYDFSYTIYTDSTMMQKEVFSFILEGQ